MFLRDSHLVMLSDIKKSRLASGEGPVIGNVPLGQDQGFVLQSGLGGYHGDEEINILNLIFNAVMALSTLMGT